MNGNDAQALRDIRYFANGLLVHADVLPLDLAVMLQTYKSELENTAPGRWNGIGDPAQYDDLAFHIGQSIADGEWAPGACLDASLDKPYCWATTSENVMSALRLLAIRGELMVEFGRYYVRPRDESS